MTDEAVFLKALAARPDDSTTRLVYADWLDEVGRSAEAFCQRWLARTGLRPVRRQALLPRRARPYRWVWGRARWAVPGAPYAVLPRAVFLSLEGGQKASQKAYHSEEAAVADLARALAELRRVLGLNG